MEVDIGLFTMWVQVGWQRFVLNNHEYLKPSVGSRGGCEFRTDEFHCSLVSRKMKGMPSKLPFQSDATLFILK